MVQTLMRVLPLAVGSAISPVVLLLQMATLASRFHAVARSLVVLAGNAGVVVLVTAVIIVGDRRDDASVATGGIGEVGAWIRIVLAVLLALTAMRLALGGHTESHQEPTDEGVADPGIRPGRYLLLGVAAMATNATSMVLFIPAVHTAVTASLSAPGELLVVVVLWLFILLPAFIPLMAFGALGSKGPAVIAQFGTWLRTHNRTIGIVVSTVFAIYLGWAGFSALA